MQLALGLAGAAPGKSREATGQTKRLPCISPQDAPMIHDPAQPSFSFARNAGR